MVEFPKSIGSIGVIDGKHIDSQAPCNAGSTIDFHSNVLLDVVDAQHRLLVLDIGSSGFDSEGAFSPTASLVKPWNLLQPMPKRIAFENLVARRRLVRQPIIAKP